MTLVYKAKGFSLIELLVVITVMMSVVGLIGGLSVDMRQKFAIKAEERTLLSLMQRASQRAFILESNLMLTLSGDSAQLFANQSGSPIHSENFSELTFSDQVVQFDAQGLPSVTSLSYDTQTRTKTLMLEGLLNEN